MNSRSVDDTNIQVMPPGQSHYDDARLTIEEIGSALLEKSERFDSLFHDIQTVTALFGDNTRIMPKQCRELIQSLSKRLNSTQNTSTSCSIRQINYPLSSQLCDIGSYFKYTSLRNRFSNLFVTLKIIVLFQATLCHLLLHGKAISKFIAHSKRFQKPS